MIRTVITTTTMINVVQSEAMSMMNGIFWVRSLLKNFMARVRAPHSLSGRETERESVKEKKGKSTFSLQGLGTRSARALEESQESLAIDVLKNLALLLVR